jgi:RNA polymerase sigma-70 factor (ECF subfamily)
VTDSISVIKAKNGDQAAFSGLVDSHYRMVYGLALSTVKDPGTAEDIAQDAFLVSWTNLQKLDNPKAFSMWLRKITRNLSLTWVRSRGYRQALAERQTALTPEAPEHAAEQEKRVARKERFEIIRSALATLSPKIREALVLFYLEGLSVAETARSLGITEGATKLRLMQGRKKLREHFEGLLDTDLQEAIRVQTPDLDRAQIARFLSIGPALPALSESVSGSGAGLISHQLIHGGPSSVARFMKTGGLIMSTKKFGIIATIAFLLCLGGIFTLPGVIDRQGEGPIELSSAEPVETQIDEAAEKDAAGTLEVSANHEGQIDSNTAIATPEPSEKQPAVTSQTPNEEKEEGKIEDPELFASVSGTVVDLKGNPVVNAEVVVSASGFDGLFNPEQSKQETFKKLETLRNESHLFSTVSGPGGKYTIEGIEYEGAAFMRAMAFGYAQPRRGATKNLTLKPGDHLDNVDILLVEGVTLEGNVISQTGEPVDDAVVSVIGYTQGQSTTSMTGQLTRTDEKGWFLLSFESPSTAAINVNSTLHGHATFMGVDIYEGATAELQMPAPASMLGSITWADHSPASGVTVLMEGQWHDPANRGNRLLGHGTTFDAVVGEEGNYELAPLDPAQFYKVSLLNRDGQPLSPPIDIGIPEAGSIIEWDHVIADAIKVYGTVFGKETREPLTNVKVAVLKDGVKMGDTEAVVQDDGTFQLTILGGEGEYHVYPRYWRLDPIEDGFEDGGQTLSLTPGDEKKQDLFLPGTFTMSFQVIDVAGRPVEEVMLSVRDPGHTWGPAGYTDAEGRWTWSGFIAGYETGIVIHAAGRRRIQSASVIGTPGETIPEEILVLQEYGGVEGTALDPNGQPIPNVPITITVEYGAENPTTFTVRTDDVGDFVVLDQVPATLVQLQLQINSGPGDLPLPLTWISEELETLAEQIINLGNIPFAGTVNERKTDANNTD